MIDAVKYVALLLIFLSRVVIGLALWVMAFGIVVAILIAIVSYILSLIH